MSGRTIDDQLRSEYFDLLPHIRRVADEVETEVRYLLIPVMRNLESHEKIVVKSRVKDCESAIDALRRRPEFFQLDNPRGEPASLRSLKDLAGVRVLAFPKQRVLEIDEALRARFSNWTADPVPPPPGTANLLALKYHGFCSPHCQVRAEIQLISMLIGLFWEVEHGALYKPGEQLRKAEIATKMQKHYADVVRALSSFEQEFETVAIVASQNARACQATADFNTRCG
jgi:ppGpp synthetase/RelA/SpoT-type nucleotidyltranferase